MACGHSQPVVRLDSVAGAYTLTLLECHARLHRLPVASEFPHPPLERGELLTRRQFALEVQDLPSTLVREFGGGG